VGDTTRGRVLQSILAAPAPAGNMRQAGTTSVAEISASYVVDRRRA
jgi:hypothetical protein